MPAPSSSFFFFRNRQPNLCKIFNFGDLSHRRAVGYTQWPGSIPTSSCSFRHTDANIFRWLSLFECPTFNSSLTTVSVHFHSFRPLKHVSKVRSAQNLTISPTLHSLCSAYTVHHDFLVLQPFSNLVNGKFKIFGSKSMNLTIF